jgi:hypothetical protein
VNRYIGVFVPEVKTWNVPMPLLIGAATAATTLLSMALGQISTGFEAFGVLLAAVVLMTLRQE